VVFREIGGKPLKDRLPLLLVEGKGNRNTVEKVTYCYNERTR